MQDYEALARLIWRNPARLGRMAGFELLQDGLHDDWIRKIAFGTGDMTIQAHRGSYKTTCLEVALWLIVLTQPDKTCGFLRKASDDVEEVMHGVARLLSTDVSAMMSECIHGRAAHLVTDTSTNISTDLACNVSGVDQISGFGIGGSLTGKHYDYIFTDDIVTVRDRASRAERERTKATYMELQNVKKRGGRIVNTGTPWHKEDCFTLMPEAEKWPLGTTGLITPEEAQELRKRMTPSLFAANYELRHIADGDAMFDNASFFADYSKLYNGIGHIDAAYGGEDGTAFTAICKHGDEWFVYGRLWPQTHVSECVPAILAISKALRIGTIYAEKNADKGYLVKELKEAGHPARGYQEKQNKYIKIATHLKEQWHRVHLLDCDEYPLDDGYLAEIYDYNETAEHDDAPDSLASAIRQYGRRAGFNTLKEAI